MKASAVQQQTEQISEDAANLTLAKVYELILRTASGKAVKVEAGNVTGREQQ